MLHVLLKHLNGAEIFAGSDWSPKRFLKFKEVLVPGKREDFLIKFDTV